MRSLRDTAIAAGFALFRATRLHRLAARWTRGRGAILMFHRVRPWRERGFAPNRLLEITPEFLEAAIVGTKAAGFEIVSLDTAVQRLRRPAATGERPFAVLTFDDGYKDNRDFALPVLERHAAPFTLYVATGFADRSARLWWSELEEAIARLDKVEVDRLSLQAGTDAEKVAAFDKVYWHLRGQGEDALLARVAGLCRKAGVDSRALVAEACMDWDDIAALSRHPLCTIGVHTLSHPRLAKLPFQEMQRELAASRAEIEARIGRKADHVSYPVGDATSAGEREFAEARAQKFASAVTTRPGMILEAHGERLHALPRLSVNGKWQDLAMFEVLLSGAPFALLNFGKAG